MIVTMNKGKPIHFQDTGKVYACELCQDKVGKDISLFGTVCDDCVQRNILNK